MATHKAARNKALSGADRLIRATYHGELWTTDAYFAIQGDMFSDYKLRKGQVIHEGEPLLDSIIDGHEYAPAESVEPNPENELDTLIVDGFEIQRRYAEAVTAYFPDAIPFVRTDGYKYAPVQYRSNDKIIGVVMPLKR